MKFKYKAQLFEHEFDDKAYCNFDAGVAKATAGKDMLLAVWNDDGTQILAIGGQQSLTINRSADNIEVSTKDTEGGWKAFIAGMKEWSIDTDGIYVADDEAHKILSKAFTESNPVCIKVYNAKTKKGMFGGLASITDYPIEAPYDDGVTYSVSLKGMGKLVDFTIDPPEVDTIPDETGVGVPAVVSLLKGQPPVIGADSDGVDTASAVEEPSI